ncbi:hypothetical protein [Niabella sp.]|uniref:hypothetical protein n=1 Tax=Niabella sp. TaxID=1962976 RepID=UPI0026253F59|nr:hypothetical protein [Niabella sp.]
MSSKTQTTRIATAFLSYEKLMSDIARMEDEVAQLRKTRDELLQPGTHEMTDLVVQEIVDYDEQVIRKESDISLYEFEMEKAITYLESVFIKIGVDKTIRVVSIDNEDFTIYRNDKNKFSREKEAKPLL